jgi:hypothetical protein
VSVMSIGTRATGPDHGHALRLHMWRGKDSVATDSLALPGGTAP